MAVTAEEARLIWPQGSPGDSPGDPGLIWSQQQPPGFTPEPHSQGAWETSQQPQQQLQMTHGKQEGFYSEGYAPGTWGEGEKEALQTAHFIDRSHSTAGPDLRAFLLESRYNSAPELPLLDHQIPPLPDNPWGNDASTRGANHQRSQNSTDVTASPGTARIGSEATPGIIRAQSQDFTIDPETGRKLRFGPAMAVRTNVVDLPSVTALFADVSSRGLKRQRRWSPSPASTPTKNAVRRRGRSSKSPSLTAAADFPLPPGISAVDEDRGTWRGMCRHMPDPPPLSSDQAVSQSIAAPSQIDIPRQQVAQVQPAEAGGKPEEAALEGTVKSGGPVFDARLPLRGKVANTGNAATSPALTQATHQAVAPASPPLNQQQRVQSRGVPLSPVSGQSAFTEDRGAGALSAAAVKTEELAVEAGDEPASGSEGTQGGAVATPAGFGGITRGVIRAAALSGKHKAPVFRLEELHRAHSQQQMQQSQSQQQRFKGVTRGPWSVTWDAHVPSPAAGLRAQLGLAPLAPDQAPDEDVQPIYVGTFLTQTSAAKAHDVAALRICLEPEAAAAAEEAAAAASDSSLSLNFSPDSYHQGMQEMRGASVSDFIQALQQHSAFETQRTSRYKGVHMLSDNEWVARFLEQEDAPIL